MCDNKVDVCINSGWVGGFWPFFKQIQDILKKVYFGTKNDQDHIRSDPIFCK